MRRKKQQVKRVDVRKGREETSLAENRDQRTHQEKFNQLLDDALLGVKKKKS